MLQKNNYSFLIASVLVLVIAACNTRKNTTACNSGFKCLMYSTSDAAKWFNLKNCNYFTFNLYYSGFQNPLQLVCYGQQQTSDSVLSFTPLSDSFPVYKDSCANVTFKHLEFANLTIEADSLKRMVADTSGNILLFVPANDPVYSEHLSYHVYLANYSFALGRITRFIKLKGNSFSSGSKYVFQDNNNNEYINLNPCPPAHLYLSPDDGINKR